MDSELQVLLLSEWKARVPNEIARSMSPHELAKHRPHRSVPDDPAFIDTTVAQWYAMCTCVFLGWVIPQTHQEFGDAGVVELEKAWAEWRLWFRGELSSGVVKRDQAATYEILRLVDLPEIYARLQTTAPGVSLEYKLTKSNAMIQEWALYEGKYKADLEMFNSCVVKRMEDERSSRLHELAEFQKQKQAGERACATYTQFYMKVGSTADFINGAGNVSDFFRGFQKT